MDFRSHPLPPRKRLLLQHNLRQELKMKAPFDVDFTLPTKKRSRSSRAPATFLLPAKKRPRALQPDCYDLTSTTPSHEMTVAPDSICPRMPDLQPGGINVSIAEGDGCYSLPAKKRKEARNIVLAETPMSSMPNKKRVMAFQPDSFLEDMFDLNVEYKPSLDEGCKLGSNFGNAEITENKTSEVVEEIGEANVGFEENLADSKVAEGEEHDECLEVETGGNFGGAVELTESKSSEVAECEGTNNVIDLLQGNAAVVKSSKEELFNGAGLEIDSNVDSGGSVEITEGEISEVAVELGKNDEFDSDLNRLKVEISEEKASVECVDVENFKKLNIGRDGCGYDLEKVTSIDGNGECDLEMVADLISNGGDVLNVTNFHANVDGDSEPECLKKVTNSEGGIECDSEPEDGIVCEICQSTDGDPSDPIVFCDGCDLMVHASCYGKPLIQGIPEGDWFCEKCAFQAEKPTKTISCCLCTSAGGGLKPTTDGRWAHIVCAIFVPEAFFVDPQGREVIDTSLISAKRWKKRCYVCEKREGCVIDCSEAKCCLSFHVTCGLKEDLCIEYREGKKQKGGIVAGFCKDHTKLWKKQQQTGKFKIVAREEQ